jgi:hypothetical protein
MNGAAWRRFWILGSEKYRNYYRSAICLLCLASLGPGFEWNMHAILANLKILLNMVLLDGARAPLRAEY